MTTEYHDDNADNTAIWPKESPPMRQLMLPSRYRWREWLFPAVTAGIILALVIALGASNTKTSNRLWMLEENISNMTDRITSSLQQSKVSEALSQLSELESLKTILSGLQCSFVNFINNRTGSHDCCPLHWELFGSSCYHFSKDVRSWDDARDWCSGQGGHLVILKTAEEWTFVTDRTMPTFYWIGLTDERTGKWEWVNQTPYAMDRRHWKPNQPDNWRGHGLGGTEDCAHIHSDGRLNDMHCSVKFRYVCQRHKQTSHT
ncbi:asialoglycoprotein receptor 1 isoform X2 [Lampris incognitus]|uniref:asialoglycoprotein receptor 1 isoform X2 n=1 Tax=Lampris incognitus TaxID=2546036 RepID=UPI0024B48C2D|nr:asialoglycoprotein receptor 1 isoform X2 [Lampris incognitus]